MKKILPIIFICTLTACATKKIPYENMTDKKIFDLANKQFRKKQYQQAKESFLKIEQEYPDSKLSAESQLMTAVSAYQAKQYGESIGYLKNFIELYPNNQKIDYAYYLLAQIYYNQILSSKRDTSNAEKTLNACTDFINRFPHSKYLSIVKKQKTFSMETLSGSNMNIGRFYEKNKNYISAIKRFQNVIVTYHASKQVPEALYRLIECYTALGLDPQAMHILQVLHYITARNIWYYRAEKLINHWHVNTTSN